MDEIELKVHDMSSTLQPADAYALVLEEVNGNRKLPIIIGSLEAQAGDACAACNVQGALVPVYAVRTKEEYDAGHIAGAILIPNETITTEQPKLLPDLDAEILVYCRSGNRSAQAANKLLAIGYTNVVDFGGIIDWPYEVVTD